MGRRLYAFEVRRAGCNTSDPVAWSVTKNTDPVEPFDWTSDVQQIAFKSGQDPKELQEDDEDDE